MTLHPFQNFENSIQSDVTFPPLTCCQNDINEILIFFYVSSSMELSVEKIAY